MLHKTLISSDLNSGNLWTMKQVRKLVEYKEKNILVASYKSCEWRISGFYFSAYYLMRWSNCIITHNKGLHMKQVFKVTGTFSAWNSFLFMTLWSLLILTVQSSVVYLIIFLCGERWAVWATHVSSLVAIECGIQQSHSSRRCVNW